MLSMGLFTTSQYSSEEKKKISNKFNHMVAFIITFPYISAPRLY